MSEDEFQEQNRRNTNIAILLSVLEHLGVIDWKIIYSTYGKVYKGMEI